MPGLLASIVLAGVITSDGVECVTLRGDNGALYALMGVSRRELKPGMKVQVVGEFRRISKCMQGQTVFVKSLKRKK